MVTLFHSSISIIALITALQITASDENGSQIEGSTENTFMKLLAEQILELEGRVWAGTLGFIKVYKLLYSSLLYFWKFKIPNNPRIYFLINSKSFMFSL